MNKILWLILCFLLLLIGSGIIAYIIYLLNLPAQLGTVFGMMLGFALFIFYMDKID